MTTRYAVMSFRQKGRALVADPIQPSKSAEAAIRSAERLSMARDGVIAIAQEVDVETDCYDEPEILYQHGTLPSDLMG